MFLDIAKFNAVVKDAKMRAAKSPRWSAAIDSAVAGIVSGWWVVTELHNCVAITTERGETYFANGKCSCEAFRRHLPCKHRALVRLIELYRERVN